MSAIIKILVVFCVILLYSTSSYSGELSVLVNGKSVHLNTDEEYNENNLGIGFQYDFCYSADKFIRSVIASGFIDSKNNTSYYVGGGYARRFLISTSFDCFHIDIGAVGIFISRKDLNNRTPFFCVLPELSVGTNKLSMNVSYVPKVGPSAEEILFFQLKILLK